MSHGIKAGAAAQATIAMQTRLTRATACCPQQGIAIVLILAAFSTVGCTCSRNAVDHTLKFMEAKAAYQESCQPNLPLAYLKHYELGWRCGYKSVSTGRRACPPAVPPQQYWAHQYQSCQGRTFVVTWYDGWRAGAAAAKSCGNDRLYRVPAIHSDCDCQSACCVAGSGTLPRPEAVRNGTITTGGAIPMASASGVTYSTTKPVPQPAGQSSQPQATDVERLPTAPADAASDSN